ncbi:hypothetical protein [Labilithrix luteola]|uniref:hypothetical protein n=1 Tax=Labilithrix luteola TaxID=1391654 RepID=UPI0011BAA6BC|nr:hypothetical protein [Labilithrix luteola]
MNATMHPTTGSVIAAGGAIVSAALLIASCSAQSKAVAAEGTYLAQQLDCVADAGTKAESRACREGVREHWDGGAK